MAKKSIECLRLEPASNGVIITYDEVVENAVKGQTYTNKSYNTKKEVFDFDSDEDEKSEFDKAFDRFKELWKAAHVADDGSIKGISRY